MGSLQKNRREPSGSILKLRGGFLNLAIRFQWHLSGGTFPEAPFRRHHRIKMDLDLVCRKQGIASHPWVK